MRTDTTKRTEDEEKKLSKEFDEMAKLAQKLAVDKWGKRSLKRAGMYQSTMAMVSILHILLDCKYHHPEHWDWLIQSFADKRPLAISAPPIITSALARAAFGHTDEGFPFIKAWPWTKTEMHAEGQAQLECLKKPLADGLNQFMERIIGSVDAEHNCSKHCQPPAGLGDDWPFDGFGTKPKGGLN